MVMVESKLNKEVVNNGIIEEYFRNKHVLLIYLARKEYVNKPTTVIDIKEAFGITKKYAWALLAKLEEDNLIKKSEKVAINGGDYHRYLLTSKANHDLKIISLCLSRHDSFCQSPKSSKCQFNIA